PYWTIFGNDHSPNESLIDEDGRIEPWKAGPSIEPFLLLPTGLVTWYDVPSKSKELVDGTRTRVTWIRKDCTLSVTGDVDDADRLTSTYRVFNPGSKSLHGSLVLAVRPFQVNPPAQFLNTTGGVARITSIEGGPDLRLYDRPPIE